MTLTIELPQELERELSDEATRQGLALSEYALRLLSMNRPSQQMPTTGAELVQHWQHEGLLGLCSDIADSQEYVRELREQAERRVRE